MKTLFYSFLLFIILSFIFIAHYFVVGQAVYGDGIYYWSYTRSIWKDKNLDLRNEVNHNYSPKSNNEIAKDNYSGSAVKSWFPIGVSVSWLPPFIAADIIASAIHYKNPVFANNGYSNLYQIIIGLFNIALVTGGTVLLYKLLSKLYPPFTALIVVVTWLFGSNLLFYGSFDVINSHPLTFLLSVVFVYYWHKSLDNRKITDWIFLGIIIGCLSVIRTQELLFIVFLILDLIRFRKKILKVIFPFLLSLLIILIIYSLQIVIWRTMYGGFFISPYMQAGFSFRFPHLGDVLWSDKNGILRWTPIFLFGFMGLFIKNKKNITILKYSVIFIIIQLLMVGGWMGMNYGGSYGMRLVLSSSFAYCFGLAGFSQEIERLLGVRWLITFSLIICLFNISNILYFLLFTQ